MSCTDLKNVRSRVRLENGVHYFDFPSLTKQEFKKDCDINLMVKRFTKANRMDSIEFMNYMAAQSPNFSPDAAIDGTAPELQVHLDAAIAADRMFMSLPSGIRTRFKNDPAQFLDFVYKPENRAELASMGLLKPEAVERLKGVSTAVKTPSDAASSSAAKVSDPSST